MSFAGKYVLTTNENYAAWLQAVGIPADSAAKLEAAKPTLEVTQNGNELAVKTVAGDKTFTNTLTLGKDSKITLPGGIEYTANLTQSGSTLSGTWNLGGKSGKVTVEFSGSGCIQTLVYNDITAKRTYARQ